MLSERGNRLISDPGTLGCWPAAHVQEAPFQDDGSDWVASLFTPQKLPKKPLHSRQTLPCLPLPFLAGIWHISSFFPQDPSFIHCQPLCSVLYGLPGRYLFTQACPPCPTLGEFLLLFIHRLHRSNLDSCPEGCVCPGTQATREGAELGAPPAHIQQRSGPMPAPPPTPKEQQ